MANQKPKAVPYRRKRERKTDYKKRLRLLLCHKPRVVVRFTNQKIIAQIIEFAPKGDKVLAGTNSSSLKKLGWNYSLKNIPAAYLTGLLLGKTVADKKYADLVLDTGFRMPEKKGKIYAFLKGLLDSGLDVFRSDKEDFYPDENRLAGEHIVKYAAGLDSNKSRDNHQFSQYLKGNHLPEEMVNCFHKVKKKIMG